MRVRDKSGGLDRGVASFSDGDGIGALSGDR
jgi:hypothetical protein